MKFKIGKEELIEALNLGGAMSGKSKTLEILKNSKLRIEKGCMIVSSFDGETAITKRVEIVEHDDDMEFCLNSRELEGFVKELDDEFIVANVDEKQMSIEYEQGHAEFPVCRADNFPKMRKGENSVKNDVDGEIIFDLLKQAKMFTSSDISRPVLTGVYLYFNGNEFGVCGSDNPSMFHDFHLSKEEYQSSNAIINSMAVPAVLNVIYGNERVRVIIDENAISFAVKDARISCRLIEGKYPNIKGMIDRYKSDNNVNVNKNVFVNSVNRNRMFSNRDSRLSLNIDVDSVEISAENNEKMKFSKERIEVKYNGDKMCIGVNGDILKKCISAIDSDTLNIMVINPVSPIIFHDNVNVNRTVLLMPMVVY